MKNDLTNLIAFFVGIFIAAALLLPGAAFAALAMVPNVPGYSSSSGAYRAPAGSFTAAANGSSYGATGTVTVSGKPVTVPAKMRMASNAGQMVKSAMRLNPWMIAGTLAAGYLADQGISWLDDQQQWVKVPPAELVHVGGWRVGTIVPNVYKDVPQEWCAATAEFYNKSPVTTCQGTPGSSISATIGGLGYSASWTKTNWCPAGYTLSNGSCVGAPAPMSDPDWYDLPDPLPTVAPELPYAPYMPNGAPVENPNYDFAPFSVPIGEPYAKPDGSTAQPMAKVSPNGDAITIDTYIDPLTNPDGTPVDNPQPQDTPEPAPDQKTDCDKYPASLGCLELGEVSDMSVGSEEMGIAAISPVTKGSLSGTGTCPADLTTEFMGETISLSWALPCQAAKMMKPLVLLVAWLSAGLIFIGGVRQ